MCSFVKMYRWQVLKKFQPMLKQQLGEDYGTEEFNMYLQPLTAIHLDNSLPAGNQPISNPKIFLHPGDDRYPHLTRCLYKFYYTFCWSFYNKSIRGGSKKSVRCRKETIDTAVLG